MYQPKDEVKLRTGLCRTGLLLALPVLASFASAQTSAPVAQADKATADEVVHLSPFSVSSEKDEGYRASNSIAGTRSNTAIKDVPLNIQVFTKDLADDLQLKSQVELERYNASLVNGGYDVRSDNAIQQAYNSFLFRGFVQNWGLRDGIRTYDPIDTAGLARVELVKGPAAALYGLTYAGGVMNSISKDVDFNRNFASLRLSAQSYGERRASVDANYSGKVADGKFGIRYNGVNAETSDERSHSSGAVRYSQTVLNWKPTATTEVKFLAENGYREKPNGLGYFSRGEGLGNGATIPLQIVHPEIPWSWNWAAGRNMRTSDTNLYRGTFTQTIGDNFTFTAYVQSVGRVNVDSNGWDAAGSGGSAASWDMGFSSQGVPDTGWLNLANGQEVIRMGYHYRDWCNPNRGYGATAIYKLDTGPIKNTITFGGNAWSEKFLSHKSIQPAGSTQTIDFAVANGINLNTPIGAPSDYFVDMAGAYGHENNSNDYYFASWQLSAIENRLKINLAMNRTNLKLVQWANGYSNTATTTTLSKNSPMVGGMFDVAKGVSVFATHSTSLFPTTDKNDFFVQMPPVVGSSNEFGVKVELLNGKISGTVSYYDISQKGGSQRDPLAFNLKKQQWDGMTAAQRAVAFPGLTRDELTSASGAPGDLVAGGTQQSKGVEADLIFQPTPAWQIVFSYASNDVKVTESLDRTAIGRSTSGAIKSQYAILSKYTFKDGAAKGLSIGTGMQSAGKALQDYSAPGGGARYYPSTFYAEVFGAYKFKALGYNHLVQLNLKNLTKQAEFVGWQATGSASTYSMKPYEVPTNITWSLTYGIDF